MIISVLLFITCLIGGFLVSFNFLAEKVPKLEEIRKLVESIKLYTGLAAFIIGLWSLIRGDLYIDFIPSILSVVCGLILSSIVFNYFNFSQDPEKSNLIKSNIQNKLDTYSTAIGFMSILFGFIHFLDVVLFRGLFPVI